MAMPRSLAFIWLSAYHCCFFPSPPRRMRACLRKRPTRHPRSLTSHATSVGRWAWRLCKQTILAQRQQFHQSRLIEHIASSDIGYQQTIDAMTRLFQAQGSNASDAASQAVAWVGQTLQHQVDLLAYIDVSRSLAIIGAIMIPIALTLKSIDLSAPARGH
jgi:MFS transporter, DHA2 family, multidrug resistance protein